MQRNILLLLDITYIYIYKYIYNLKLCGDNYIKKLYDLFSAYSSTKINKLFTQIYDNKLTVVNLYMIIVEKTTSACR